MTSENNGVNEPRLFSDGDVEHREAEECHYLEDDISQIPEVEVVDLLSSDITGITGSYKIWKEKSLNILRRALCFNEPSVLRHKLKVPWRPLHHAPTNYYILLKGLSQKPIKWSINIVHGKLGMPVFLHEVEDDEDSKFDTIKSECIKHLKDMVKGHQKKLRISRNISDLDELDCCHKAGMILDVPIAKRTKRKCYLNSLLDLYPKCGILKPGEEEVIKLKVHHELLGIFTFSYKFEFELVNPDPEAEVESPRSSASLRQITEVEESTSLTSLDSIPGPSTYMDQEKQKEYNKVVSFGLDISIPTFFHKVTDSFMHHIDNSFDFGVDSCQDSQKKESIANLDFERSQSAPDVSESDLKEKMWRLIPGYH